MQAAPYAEGWGGSGIEDPNQALGNFINRWAMYQMMGLNPAEAGRGIAPAVPTIPSRAIGTGLGYGPTSIAGTSSIPTAEELIAGSAIPTIASRQIGNGMGTGPTDISGALRQLPDLVWDGTKWVDRATSAAKSALTGDGGAPSWLGDVIKALAGVGTSLAALNTQKQGPSDEEKAFQAQAARLLKQQEQRTQFQNPLYAYITQQAYNLQPGPDKGTYPYNSLDDVKVP